jgi:hypothetical protein
MPQKNDERQLILAIQALKRDPALRPRVAARIYSVDHRKLGRRLQGIPSRRDISANSRKLTDLEESVLVQYILDLAAKGFPPRVSVVEDMANRLLAIRDQPRVGTRWASNFVKRRPELRTRFQQRYDYQRAKCEDPEVIRGWFELVRNTIAKYGIHDVDIYNFDETGFMMGVISTGMVVTSSDGRAKAKRIQPGNREWITVIQGVNSLGWTVPPFVIVAAKNNLNSWYRNSGFPPGWVISVTDNGWTTNERGMDWIRHFEKHTRSLNVGGYRLLILDGHESHHSDEFEEYCKENNIITLCMPPHSSHILQPLDVGCFGPLKKAYGRQIENMMQAHIHHITKDDFFPAFHAACNEAMTESNIQGGFRGAGLLPFDPEKVISGLDLKLKTPTPSKSRPSTAQPWVSQTPNNPIEALSQTTFIKNRIAHHQNSSPTSIYEAVDHFAKGASKVMHQLALLKAENQSLRQANEELSKRRRAKKTRLRQGGSLSVQEAQALQDEMDVARQVEQEIRASSSRKPRQETRARHCGNCNEPGHNARTCQTIVETSKEEDSK